MTVSFLVSRLFARPIRQILGRLVPEDLTGAWHRYPTFAVYVVGISGGARIWSLETVHPAEGTRPWWCVDWSCDASANPAQEGDKADRKKPA